MRQRCRIRTLRSLPREHLNRSIIVRRHLMTHRTNQRIPIRHLRQTRKNLADVQPRDICRNRTKRPPILTRCLRLRIKCLQLTGTAPHPEQNHRRVRNSAGRNRSSPLSRQQLRQRQTTRRQHTRSQKFPTTTRPSTEFRLPHHITPRSLKTCAAKMLSHTRHRLLRQFKTRQPPTSQRQSAAPRGDSSAKNPPIYLLTCRYLPIYLSVRTARRHCKCRPVPHPRHHQ